MFHSRCPKQPKPLGFAYAIVPQGLRRIPFEKGTAQLSLVMMNLASRNGRMSVFLYTPVGGKLDTMMIVSLLSLMAAPPLVG